MPNYQKSKIYCIRSHQCKYLYIGSTTQSLALRMAGHRAGYKKYLSNNKNFLASFHILKYPDAYIELVEKYPCEDRDELLKHEGEHIRETENCININIAGNVRHLTEKIKCENCYEWICRRTIDNHYKKTRSCIMRGQTIRIMQIPHKNNFTSDQIEKHISGEMLIPRAAIVAASAE